ncbi:MULTISPECIES: transketolase [Streptococcus]|uniref:Transketolase n=1 Tax=Streptococcus ruminantium TaxID=1917441 RepID=A0ABU1B1H9_9STRE|nr:MULTISPECIES: transketolase [Streptococcus]MDQ8758426.1 transketolase [Streptococcus ruminantium]MDQ8764843.1 transketolase [Streptococcus ruminantium]MDQ8768212.1 transketolase [Streptococcus ruminantium]MDQ8773890.1 transketolase [Streptococcus ruminantium]MDQ8779956.1 transketolase [Streptococcus ruminantium]
MAAELARLRQFTDEIRYHTIATLNQLGFGHYGGSLSIVEVLAVLYGEIMDITVQNFSSRERDHFILSKGHAGPALYSALYLKGFFDHDFLWSLNRNGTSLPSHPDRNLTPGIDMTTGSLGQGMSVATGVAYGQKIANFPYYTYTLVGDGELNEGQCWEAAQFAAHHELSHLILFVDDNKKQLDGRTVDICQTFDFVEKFISFGWEAVRVDGSDIVAILNAITTVKTSRSNKPKCIVLDTIKGQGVPLLENMENNHHLRLAGNLLIDLEKVAQDLEKELEGRT